MYNSLRSLEKITGILDSIKTLCFDKQLLKQVVQEYTNGHFLQHNRQNLSNVDRMSVSNVLTGCKGTTHGGVMRQDHVTSAAGMRMMEPQYLHPS